MSKEDSGRLLQKVAKFVRNPLKDWSELDVDDASALENGYSREMLKEMIERRQRNDFVRRREFDMLRKLRRREAAGDREPGATPSSFNVSSTDGKTEGRALTLKKIDEIEEQMSQQWWKSRGPDADAKGTGAGAAVPPGGDMAGQHARAYADTEPGTHPPAPATGPAALDGSVEEAAVRFAHGDDAGTEAILLQALAPDGASVLREDLWRVLFDFYRATGEDEKFVAACTRFAQAVRKTGPEWISLPALAAQLQAGADADREDAAPAQPAAQAADWSAPPILARDGLLQLTRALAAAGPRWTLDWSMLMAIDPGAAGPLRALFAHWADGPTHLRFAGTERLLEVLAQATPVNDRNVDAVWWQLHMAALRLMHRADDFELLALNYCITYEVSPPPWEDPKGEFTAEPSEVAAPPEAASHAGISPASRPAGARLVPPGHQAGSPVAVLSGELRGESLATWKRLDAELSGAASLVISCAALVRVDLVAGGTLLNWVTARAQRNQRVHFVDAHRLLSAFFVVIGIADHASVSVRDH